MTPYSRILTPAPGGVSLNVGSLMTGHNNTGGHTCIHSKNSTYEMAPMSSPTTNMRQDTRANLIQVSCASNTSTISLAL